LPNGLNDVLNFFRRADITVRCAYRGTTLVVPDRDALLDACEAGQRRRLQWVLARQSGTAPAWSLEWAKAAGDELRARDVVAMLRAEGVVVELAYAQRGVLAEALVESGARVGAGTALARLERRAKAAAPASSTTSVLKQYVLRQRQDAETIRSLQAELAEQQQVVGRLGDELATLRPGRAPSEGAAVDLKFRRIKHEFSKHYHPDARPSGDAERRRRERVFQEFWPIVEEIERS